MAHVEIDRHCNLQSVNHTPHVRRSGLVHVIHLEIWAALMHMFVFNNNKRR